MNKDTLIVLLSDLHSGSNYALFLSRPWKGKNENSHIPSGTQELITPFFWKTANEIAKLRQGKRVILVEDGDMIEGSHHNNIDVCTRDPHEQADIHIEIVNNFMKVIKWQKGDLFYAVRGTLSHTQDVEIDIAKELNAQEVGGEVVSDVLDLEINGKLFRFLHEGPASGRALTEGEPLRRFIRDMVVVARKNNKRTPDYILTGHFHSGQYNTYVEEWQGEIIVHHGLLLPSLQAKTRYAFMKTPLSINRIGVCAVCVSADGEIHPPHRFLMETRNTNLAKI